MKHGMKFLIGGLVCLFAICFVVTVIAADFPCTGSLNGDNVNVRIGPSTKHAKLTRLSRGDSVTVLAREGKWFKIAVPRKATLYISSKFVKKTGASSGEVTGDRVNVRSGVGAADAAFGQAGKGQAIEIIGQNGNWYLIKPFEGLEAYIYAKYVDLKSGAAPVPPAPPKKTDKPLPPIEIPKTDNGNGDEDGPEVEARPEEAIRKFASRYDAWKSRMTELKIQMQAAVRNEDWDRLQQLKDERVQLEEMAKTPEFQAYIEAVGRAKETKDNLENLQNELDNALRDLKKKQRFQLYIAIGVLNDVAPCLFSSMPGDYKLKQGDNVLFYLKSVSPDVNLEDYLFKRVGVIGKRIPSSEKDGIDVIEVSEIDVIED